MPIPVPVPDPFEHGHTHIMRAAIDIGTNTVLMLVGTRRPDNTIAITEDHATITRLGQGVAQSGRLLPEAIARTLAVLERYRDIARSHSAEIVAVATEGVRMASDPERFLVPAQQLLGAPIRLIAGDEEAELSYRSIAVEHGTGELRVLDIGGASTELVAGDGERVHERRSHAIGSVRLTERFVHHDPPTKEELTAIEDAAQLALSSQPMPPHPELHGLAGTVTSAGALMLGLSAYDRDRVDGLRVATSAIVALRDRLAAATLAERVAMPILGVGRGDVIVAGLTILVAALRHCGAETLVVRDRGLRFALV